ncbi:acetate--CoA ligase family protein [Yoonia sp. MH D7]
MTRDLSRLLRPTSIAIIGGGAWCRAVTSQLIKSGYSGHIWPVHPKGGEINKIRVYSSINDLPSAPDASFIGINRTATIDTVQTLADMGAGGAVCFASGFAEVDDGHTLNTQLLSAAGKMPILGPNCYGIINNLDGALLWPDQHGCTPVTSGVAILTQSSNIAINLTMQSRALPISYVITCGNQAQTTQAEIALGLLDDPRVTAIGLHIEGFGDTAAWQNLARAAHIKNIPLVALKVGKSTQAQAATISHTASLAGSDAGANALLKRLGIARVDDLPTLIETLKILHVAGSLPNTNIATISCSGGEASLAADLAHDLDLTFPALNKTQHAALSKALGPKVTLANPLDYHTYIWRDTGAMTSAFSAMIDPVLALTMLIVDFPRDDRCDASDWECTVQAAINTRAQTGGNIAMVATLPELMPESIAHRLIAGGVIPLNGLREALHAASHAQAQTPIDLHLDLVQATQNTGSHLLSETHAKLALSKHGLRTPANIATNDITNTDMSHLRFPVVLKGTGFAHKTEAGAVALNLPTPHSVIDAAALMNTDNFLIEEMVTDTVAELLIGIIKDPAHGLVLTIGAGGILTELLQDTVSLLLPSSKAAIEQSLTKLKCHKLITGYRGKPAANINAIISAILAIQDYALANIDIIEEVEINPLICIPDAAIAVDALIRIAK